jgi:glutaredoxin
VTPRFALRALLACAVLAVPLPACERSSEQEEQESASLAPKPNELPPLELRDDTKDLLLTWVDEKGDFHVVQKPGDVPKEARQRVRVVVATKQEGTGRLVYVADLRNQSPDGTYPVETMTRAQWDEVGASRRQARLEALAPSARPATAAPSAATSEQRRATKGEVVAIIYGAEWCKPCHDAARYLKKVGVTVVEKDIDADALAKRQMVEKLRRANLPPTSSIPIIDVMGQLLVGFSPQALSRAVQSARDAKRL